MMKLSISVNGYHEQMLSAVLEDDLNTTTIDPPAIDVRSDTEVHFNGRAQLDNGLKIHARWELEGNSHTSAGKPSPANGNDQIDEMWLSVSGSFGQVIVGSTDNAAVKMLTGMTGAWATNVGQNFHFNSESWIPSAAGTAGGRFHVMHDARIREHGGGGDSEKISYISPKFGGFQAGVSYIPYADQDNHVTHNVGEATPASVSGDTLADHSHKDASGGARHDGMAGAVSYTAKVGDVGAAVGAGWSTMQGAGNADDLNEWLVTGRLDFGGGFRVAVAHQRTTGPDNLKGSVTEGGVRYTIGANAFSLVGSYGELENTSASYTAAKAAYRRTLGPGVFWHANLWMNRSESDTGVENSGSAVSSGMTVVF